MKSDNYTNCSSCDDKYICPHSARGNFCGTKNGETRPDFEFHGRGGFLKQAAKRAQEKGVAQ